MYVFMIHSARDSSVRLDRGVSSNPVIPAKAGIQVGAGLLLWIPAFAGVTNEVVSARRARKLTERSQSGGGCRGRRVIGSGKTAIWSGWKLAADEARSCPVKGLREKRSRQRPKR